MAHDANFPLVNLDPLGERPQMVVAVGPLGSRIRLRACRANVPSACGVSVGPGFSISAAARPKITGARFLTAFVSNPLMAP